MNGFDVNSMLYRCLGIVLLVTPPVFADDRIGPLLDEQEYRLQQEEVVVTGQSPQWRKPQQSEWRPEKFELPESTLPPRFEWWPEYTVDERDAYDTVRDRMGEKAAIKSFECRF